MFHDVDIFALKKDKILGIVYFQVLQRILGPEAGGNQVQQRWSI
jgi:hypothetical protein